MANIKVTVDYPISDGTKLKFRTPCESTEVESLVVRYPVKDGVGYALKTFRFVDANGNELSGMGNVFASDVMIAVLLDVTKGRAFIKNADNNAHIENIKASVERMDEERKTIFADVGKVLKSCKEAFEKCVAAAKGVVTIEQNRQRPLKFWVGTKEEYDAIETHESDSFYIISDEQPTDYIVEHGEEGIWKYTKWNSGKIEFMGTGTFSDVAITQANDNTGSFYSDPVSIPLPCNMTSDVIAIISNASAGVWLSQYKQFDHENIQFRVNALKSCTTTVYPRIFAWSTWK